MQAATRCNACQAHVLTVKAAKDEIDDHNRYAHCRSNARSGTRCTNGQAQGDGRDDLQAQDQQEITKPDRLQISEPVDDGAE